LEGICGKKFCFKIRIHTPSAPRVCGAVNIVPNEVALRSIHSD